MITRTALLAAFAQAILLVAPHAAAFPDQPHASGAAANPPADSAHAVLYVASEQNVGYAVSFDASQSKGTNPLGKVDIFGIKTYTWDFADGTPQQSSAYLPTLSHTFILER